MNFSAWAIRNPVPPILVFALLTLVGLMGFSRLDVQEFPDMDLPTISITASLDGAAAAQLETDVARRIENGLTGLDRLDTVSTTVTDGSVRITAIFEVGKDSQVALEEVKNAVSQVEGDLPSEMASPVVTKSELSGGTLVAYVVSSDRLDEAELSWLIDNDIDRALMQVEGVGAVSRVGGITRQIHVALDPQLLEGLGLTASDVNGRLEEVQRDLSGGKGQIGGASQSVRVLAAASSIEELRATPIPLPNGDWARLDELGTVTDTHAERSSLAYHNGEPVIAFEVQRSRGYSDLAVADGIHAAVDTFLAQNPQVTIEEAYNTVTPIEQNYTASMTILYEGAALAIIVVFLFLRDWRATFVAATALPLSIIPTFYVMDWLGYSLNTVTLLALSLVVGVLVDDAIVEIENIERHQKMGKKPLQAAAEAADEIGLAVIATTATLIAVFLPTAFMSGIAGLFFIQFGVTASVAVFCSLLVARLLTPMMAAYMLKSGATRQEPREGWIMGRYLGLMRIVLRRRWLAVVGVVGFLGVTVLLMASITVGFLPAEDNSQTEVSITTPPGSTLGQTDFITSQVAEIVARHEHVTGVFQSTGTAAAGDGPGGGGGATDSVTTATLVANLTPIADRSISQVDIEKQIRASLTEIPGARIAIGEGGNESSLLLTLAGNDNAALERAARALEAEARQLSGIGTVTTSLALQTPEVVITPDLELAASLGITSRAISNAVRIATSGAYSSSLSKLNLPERQVPIVVMLDSEAKQSLEDMALIPVPGPNGNVSLGTIADLSIGSAPSSISRLDRMRNVTVTIELNGRNLATVQGEVEALDAYRNVPAGVVFVEQGELAMQSELFTSFGSAMAIGIFCVYAVLVLLFRDFLQPITILMALPLALGGALFPLAVTGTSFSMPVLIGLLLLMGIVSKNSILLVDYTIIALGKGASRFDALIEACRKRARPIVMTTIAMSGGMAPAALSWVEGDPSFRQPMAVVVIGGLLTSTVFSLVVVPVAFSFVDDVTRLLRKLRPSDMAPAETAQVRPQEAA